MRPCLQLAILGGLTLTTAASGAARGAEVSYQQTNLVTNATDPDLINPWGISFGPTSPFWVSDNGTGKATLYNGAGVKQGLVVTMPAGSEPITGQVFNGTSNFHGDTFLFASENGTIAGWREGLGTTAELATSVTDAVYKGLAISPTKDVLYAANFHAGTIDVFNATNFVHTGSFSDPTVPAGYAPFNIQNLNGTFYVQYAKQDAAGHDDVPGPGHGLVEVFNPTTATFTRLVTGSDAGGTVAALNSPWGVARAPASFGPFGGSLLVGNFGDGVINAFNPTTGALLGQLTDSNGSLLVNPGLWGLTFGNGGNGGNPDILYFTAGGANEDTGVFGQIAAVPEPGSLILLGLGGLLAVGVAYRHRGRPFGV